MYSEAESLIAIVAHEVCHYLGYTDQIPKHGESHVYRRRAWNSTDEVETGEFQIRAVEAYRLSNRNVTATDTPPDSDPVTVNDTRCRECEMKLGARQAFCSDRCRWTFHNRQRSQRTAAGRKMKTCEACGKGFVPRRSDARTCSSACRQKLHRLRGQTRARNTG